MKFSPGNPGDINTRKGIIEAGFDLLQKDINDITIMDLPYKLRKFSTI